MVKPRALAVVSYPPCTAAIFRDPPFMCAQRYRASSAPLGKYAKRPMALVHHVCMCLGLQAKVLLLYLVRLSY